MELFIAEAGEGPLVVLSHGWPECWYSWRHQLSALADAGFHAVAPDQRGYGRSTCPPEIDDYTVFHLVGDLVGLVEVMGQAEATLVGHDWGSIIVDGGTAPPRHVHENRLVVGAHTPAASDATDGHLPAGLR